MQDTGHDMIQTLLKQRAECEARLQKLWQGSARQRVSAMRRGRLSLIELCAWAARRPEEVPLVNGEFEFIAMFTPEAADRDPKNKGR